MKCENCKWFVNGNRRPWVSGRADSFSWNPEGQFGDCRAVYPSVVEGDSNFAFPRVHTHDFCKHHEAKS